MAANYLIKSLLIAVLMVLSVKGEAPERYELMLQEFNKDFSSMEESFTRLKFFSRFPESNSNYFNKAIYVMSQNSEFQFSESIKKASFERTPYRIETVLPKLRKSTTVQLGEGSSAVSLVVLQKAIEIIPINNVVHDAMQVLNLYKVQVYDHRIEVFHELQLDKDELRNNYSGLVRIEPDITVIIVDRVFELNLTERHAQIDVVYFPQFFSLYQEYQEYSNRKFALPNRTANKTLHF